MNALRAILCASLYAALMAVAGCGSPLVGLECQEGFAQCDDGCYDLQSDPANCGGCDIVCAANQQCTMGMCVPGVPGEGGLGDGGEGGMGDGGDAGDGGIGDGGDADMDADMDADTDGGDSSMDARADADTGTGTGGDTGTGDTGTGMDGALDGAVTLPDGAVLLPDGAIIGEDGAVLNPSDADVDMDGAFQLPDGSVVLPDGAILLPDGAIVDPDGGLIGGDDEGGTGDDDAGDTDAAVEQPPVICFGSGSPPDCVCGLGQIKCGDICVDPNTDRNNCGACANVCPVDQFCSTGVCTNICQFPTVYCNGICADFSNDNANCGSCNNACEAAAACIQGMCIGQAIGHVVVIGHDMSATRAPMDTLVGNAVFLGRGTTLRVLIYAPLTITSDATRTGIQNAINARVGRTPSITYATRELVTSQLSSADTFVIAVQQGATDADLIAMGNEWGAALHEFLRFGGVIVLFDAGGSNAGTHQILTNATRTLMDSSVISLFETAGRTELPQRILRNVTPADAVATMVPTEYQSEGVTAGFQSPSGTVVIQDPDIADGNLPVVIHLPYEWEP